MALREFGKFNDKSKRLMVLHRSGMGGGAAIYAPTYDQSNTNQRNSKDGHARKHYAVTFYGRARKGAPCSHLGLWGTAAEVITKVKTHLAAAA